MTLLKVRLQRRQRALRADAIAPLTNSETVSVFVIRADQAVSFIRRPLMKDALFAAVPVPSISMEKGFVFAILA